MLGKGMVLECNIPELDSWTSIWVYLFAFLRSFLHNMFEYVCHGVVSFFFYHMFLLVPAVKGMYIPQERKKNL